MSSKLCLVIGTRPEAIKVLPVVRELRRRGKTNYCVLSTGQHRQLLAPYWKIFDVLPDFELELISDGQTLGQLTGRAFSQIDDFLERHPEVGSLLAEGDTTTVMATAVTAFYRRIPFAHLEAGLRTYDILSPFPEELYRRIAAQTADVHFAPTIRARDNLRAEQVTADRIYCVGNTVVDAIEYVKSLPEFGAIASNNVRIRAALLGEKEAVLVTCHRRENHDRLMQLIGAVSELSRAHPDMVFIWPVHPNPKVRTAVLSSPLASMSNVYLVDPLEYVDNLRVISRCVAILSDSGGIQEEAPSFAVPVLVLRDNTERPEAIEAGQSMLVPMEQGGIVEAFHRFRPGRAVFAKNPFGDGRSAERVVDVLEERGLI